MLAKYKVLEFCFLHKVAQLTYLIHEIITILFVQIFTHFETYNFVDILSNGNANVVLYIYIFLVSFMIVCYLRIIRYTIYTLNQGIHTRMNHY
jgi:hypothetical protein